MEPSALTVRFDPVVPVAGLTESQLVELVTEATALKVSAVLLLVVTCTVCDAGAGPPAVWLNVREVGFSVMFPAVTWNVTGMVIGVAALALATVVLPGPVAVIEIVPV